MTEDEQASLDELQRLKLQREVKRLEQEIAKIALERKFYPAIIVGGLTVAVGTAFNLILRAF